jgi:Immunity protein 17
MNDDPIISKISDWISGHGHTFSLIVSLSFLVFGILAVIGAILNWDWMYKPDVAYHNNWNIHQISRYLGRDVARVLGVVGGIMLMISGAYWSYAVLARK